jgi:hypothetical protein
VETFRDLLLEATGRAPIPYQERLSAVESIKTILNVPATAGTFVSRLFSWRGNDGPIRQDRNGFCTLGHVTALGSSRNQMLKAKIPVWK